MVMIKRRATTQILSQFAGLERLAPRQLELLAEASTVEELPAGRLLFKPGVREHENLYLLSGEIALMADHQAVDNVVGGTDAARQALAPERPRRLWGWSKCRCQVVCIDSGLVERICSNDPMLESAADDRIAERALRAQVSELQHALRQAESQRDQARQESQDLRAALSKLQTKLAQAQQAQAQQPQVKDVRPKATSTAVADAPPERSPQTSVRETSDSSEATVRVSICATDDAAPDTAVPNLRIDPSERHALAPAELEDLFGSKTLEIPADRRCRGH